MLFSRKSQSRNDLSSEPEGATERAFKDDRRPVVNPPSGHAISSVATGDGSTHIQSFIDASLTIVGDLHSENDVRIDGRICGNVRCAQLIVSRGAVITGAVMADVAIVRGKVTGTIRANAVVIQDTAHVESEIIYGQIAIDDGAIFEGSARLSRNALEEATVTPLAELQQEVTSTVDRAVGAGARKPGDGREPAADTSHVVVDAPAAGKPNGRGPAANGHNAPG